MAGEPKRRRKAPAPKPRGHRADEILDIAEMLIQTRGYSAFSYHDIALALGIRKASIHYHFASKVDLGLAVIARYTQRFAAELERIAREEAHTSWEMLEFYSQPYLMFAETPDRVCLSGALAGEILALPKAMRTGVEAFFKAHQAWLETILARGLRRGEFRFEATPARMARLVFGAFQGALLVKRTTGDTSQVRDVVTALKSQLLSQA